jgi:hypothetical protein
MEGLDEYAREHPDVSICRVDRVYHAWKAAPDGKSGEAAYAEDAEGLLAKLAG